jgi:hypothetical protein
MIRIGSRERPREQGQIIIVFALMLSVLMILAALLYSGAQTLVNRRQLQNAGDAAALAAANLMENGTSLCNSTRISPTLSGNDLYVAAKNSVMTNLGWTAAQVTARMTLTCPSSSAYGSVAVTINLSVTGPQWFGAGNLQVNTASTGINGQVTNGDYSVALLDPMPTLSSGSLWSNSIGCPSYLFNGGVSVTYEGSIFVDSTCTRTINNSGAVDAHNSAFSMTLVNGARLLTGGEVSSGTMGKITPTPTENARPLLADPFAGLTMPCHATGSTANCLGGNTALPARDMGTNGQGLCKNTKVACVLQPGTYVGGILAANGGSTPTLLLRPGVYYIEGGGLQLKSGAAQIISIPSATSGKCTGTATVSCTDAEAVARYCNPTNQNNGSCQVTSASTPTSATNWHTDCPEPPAASTCGVLIYNATTDGNTAWTTTGNSDNIQNGAQGTMLLRAYNPTYDAISGNGTTFASYKNLVMWQAREPLPASGSPQPVIKMAGGACVVLSGSVYASGAEVQFGGSSCGTGGGADAQLTLQFVCWDLTLSGNNSFYFAYRRNSLATPFAYGLVQ